MGTDSSAIINYVSGSGALGEKVPMDRVWDLAMARIGADPELELRVALRAAADELIDFVVRGDMSWRIAAEVREVVEYRGSPEPVPLGKRRHIVTANMSCFLNDLTLRLTTE